MMVLLLPLLLFTALFADHEKRLQAIISTSSVQHFRAHYR